MVCTHCVYRQTCYCWPSLSLTTVYTKANNNCSCWRHCIYLHLFSLSLSLSLSQSLSHTASLPFSFTPPLSCFPFLHSLPFFLLHSFSLSYLSSFHPLLLPSLLIHVDISADHPLSTLANSLHKLSPYTHCQDM